MSRRVRIGVGISIVLSSALLFWQAYARYASFHNETFDLAFYTRMAWGLSRADFWEPIVGAHIFGVHLSPVMVPLGLLGYVLPLAPLLLLTQAIAIAATAWPLARIGHARFGDLGAVVAAAMWLLYPNIGHVATYEFHPGTLAVLPAAWAIWGVVGRHRLALGLGCLGVLLCREDLALLTFGVGVMAYLADKSLRRFGFAIAGVSIAYLALFLFYLHPTYAPEHGSLQLHFGSWGDSMPEALWAMVTQPAELLEHLAAPERLSYLPRFLVPLAFLPLLRPRWLVVALPVLAINLLSEWPTTTELDSHYQTVALPFAVVAALEGAQRARKKLSLRNVSIVASLCLLATHFVWGGTPVAADYEADMFRQDARSGAARRVVAELPADATVQAPYAILPHIAERQRFGPPPPPERVTDYVVLDAWHREEFAQREELIRTTEEPIVRGWLAREDYGLVAVEPPYLVLARNEETRQGPASRYLVGRADPSSGERLAACLHLLSGELGADGLTLELVAAGPCASDLAIRIGSGSRPRRVDLLFDGLLSPAQLRRGDRLRSVHGVSDEERDLFRQDELRVGLLRESGARPEHADPVSIAIPL